MQSIDSLVVMTKRQHQHNVCNTLICDISLQMSLAGLMFVNYSGATDGVCKSRVLVCPIGAIGLVGTCVGHFLTKQWHTESIFSIHQRDLKERRGHVVVHSACYHIKFIQNSIGETLRWGSTRPLC